MSYAFVLEDVRTARHAQRLSISTTWARILIGKGSPETLAALLAKKPCDPRPLRPFCVSEQHADELEALGLVTIDDVLERSVADLLHTLSHSAEAAVLALSAALRALVEEQPGPFQQTTLMISFPGEAPDPAPEQAEVREPAPYARNGIHTRRVREWARMRGYRIADRGRIPVWILDGYRRECLEPETAAGGHTVPVEVLDENAFLNLLRGS
ncbi:Lsr2 family DNA-binding protein [Microtetraspora malaysiensis]|uniref:Lsr2 family DNA-binding protein n=1 Tax=Microtetraspora malaysiensis TaxID=161358 RepID=UPI003D8FA233